jgi:selenocysteine lyase/cysteine desulfurase
MSATTEVDVAHLSQFPIFAVSRRERTELLDAVARGEALFDATNCRLLLDLDALARRHGGGLPLPGGSAPAEARAYYSIESNCFLNHGAFGAPLRVAQAAAADARALQAADPPQFVDRLLFPFLVHVACVLARYIGARPQDVFLARNATAALNAVIASVPLRPGAVLFALDVGYRSVRKMLLRRAAASGASLHEHALVARPRSVDEVVADVERGLPPCIDIAVIETITSNTALALPLDRLVPMLRARGAVVIVDAAHTLGSDDPGALLRTDGDYVVSNAHKWFSCAPGAAMLWMNPRLVPDGAAARDALESPVVSHGSGEGPFSSLVWDGYGDYGALLALPACVAFWERYGPARAVSEMRALRRAATALLERVWEVEAYAPDALCGAAMALVPVPAAVERELTNGGARPPAYKDACALQDRLWAAGVVVPVKVVCGRLHVRISCAVHNRLDDYQRLADVLLSPA